jgi:Ca2+-dependent lipid-binding protein
VHDDCQELSLKVFDEDFGSADDLIGSAKKEIARLVITKGKQAVPLLKENGEEGGGNLTISASFLKLVVEKPPKPLPNPSQAHLSIKVLTITGLPNGSEHPFKVRIQAIMPDEGSNAISMPSNTSLKSNPLPSNTSVKPSLKPSKSMVPAGVQGKVLVEEMTNASHPKEQKELAEALRGVAVNLHERKTPTKDIAEILKVSEHQVQRFLEKHDQTDKKAIKAHEEAMKEERSVHHPRFDEVIQMLLPAEACDELSVVEFAVMNKRQKVIATAMIPMPQLLHAKDLMCEGPFRCVENDGVEVVAKAHLRWLA